MPLADASAAENPVYPDPHLQRHLLVGEHLARKVNACAEYAYSVDGPAARSIGDFHSWSPLLSAQRCETGWSLVSFPVHSVRPGLYRLYRVDIGTWSVSGLAGIDTVS
jgi:hypothetical protein